eukprot:gene7826-188_t
MSNPSGGDPVAEATVEATPPTGSTPEQEPKPDDKADRPKM